MEQQFMRLKPFYYEQWMMNEIIHSHEEKDYRAALPFPDSREGRDLRLRFFCCSSKQFPRLESEGARLLSAMAGPLLGVKVTPEGMVYFTCPVKCADGSHPIKMKPGKFIAKYFDFGDGVQVPDEMVRAFAAYCKRMGSRYKLSFGTELSDWFEAYEQGPNSCMSHVKVHVCDAVRDGGFKLLNGQEAVRFDGPVNPVIAYCSGDFAIAVVRDELKNGKIVARAVCSPSRGLFGKTYGDDGLISPMLEAAGYRSTTSSSRWKGCKLNAIPAWEPGRYLMPYLDFAGQASLEAAQSGLYFKLGDGGEFDTQATDGLTRKAKMFICDGCGDEVLTERVEDSTFRVIEDSRCRCFSECTLCSDCLEHYNWSNRHGAFYSDEIREHLHFCSQTGQPFTEQELEDNELVRCAAYGDWIDRKLALIEDSALVMKFSDGQWQPVPEEDASYRAPLAGGKSAWMFCLNEVFGDELKYLEVSEADLPREYRKRVEPHIEFGSCVFIWLWHRGESEAMASAAQLENDSVALQAMLENLYISH